MTQGEIPQWGLSLRQSSEHAEVHGMKADHGPQVNTIKLLVNLKKIHYVDSLLKKGIKTLLFAKACFVLQS